MRVRTRQNRSAVILGSVAVLALIGFAHSHENGVCSFEHNQMMADACAPYSTIDNISNNLRPLIRSITSDLDYFGYYRLNLYGKQCPFWSDDEGMCGNIACAVNTIDDEKDIPLVWRAKELGKLAGPKATHPTKRKKEEPSPLGGALGEGTDESCIVEDDECDERDYCVPEDETVKDGDYVSLKENPERFTGYAGEGTWAVWSAIYRENCFSKAPLVENSNTEKFSHSFPKSKQQAQALGQLKNVMLEHPKMEVVHQDGQEGSPGLLHLDVDDECLEKRVFYRIISGMHASISMHLCYDYLNQSTGEWGPNLSCFIQRFQGHPERIQNIYFNYSVVLRAVAKLRNYLNTYTFCSADPYQNRLTKAKTLKLSQEAASGPQIFDETLMFRDANAIELKEDFKNRFRNVSRLMDCVGCDKCRLWGKVQTQGYGTALKVLFEFDEDAANGENPPLRRTELVALVNTLDRLSNSLMAVEKFQVMWEAQRKREEAEEKARRVNESARQGHRYHNHDDESLWEAFIEEVGVVKDAMFHVVKSWFYFPSHMLSILHDEASLIIEFFRGRPKRDRKHQWKLEPVDIRGMRKAKAAARNAVKDEL